MDRSSLYATAAPVSGFYPAAKVLEITTFSESTLWRKVREKSFPPPCKLGARRVGWPIEVVNAWVQARKPVSEQSANEEMEAA
jgi:predicted DNA-binding transcriptional regulator AlpA